MTLPPNHPQRVRLNDEVHARPPEPLQPPCRLSYLALLCDADASEASFAAVTELAVTCGVAPPPPGAKHYSADLFAFRLKWERHTEFVRYTFIVPPGIVPSGIAPAGPVPASTVQPGTAPAATGHAFEQTALAAVPSDWVANLPGRLIVAAHLVLAPDDELDPATLGQRLFPREVLVGSSVLGGLGSAFTDFRIYPDGFSRLLVQDRGMTPWQAGRLCQSLLEVETYRIMALLALPVAQAAAPQVAEWEHEVARITAAMVAATEPDEPLLLDRLTRIAAEIDSALANNLFRFTAAAAYDGIVRARIEEMREQRLTGLQTLQEFTERRLAPAMNTCRSVASRQEELSRRVARATQMLATRVGVTRERQSQDLLGAMNRRTQLQLRLQSTVEGLSVAAVTYYVSALVGKLAEGLHQTGLPIRAAVTEAVSVPIVALLVWLGARRIHRMVRRDR